MLPASCFESKSPARDVVRWAEGLSNASLPFCHVCFHCTYRACSGKAFATEKHARSFAVEQPIRIVVELARSMQIMSHTSPVPQCFECGSGAHLHPPSEHATTETMQCCMVVSRGKCVLFCCAFLFSVLLCFDPADVRHHPREQSSIITSRTKNQELILHNYYYFQDSTARDTFKHGIPHTHT